MLKKKRSINSSLNHKTVRRQRNIIAQIVWFGLALCWASTSYAQQLQFDREGLSYRYQWQDAQSKVHKTRFELQQYPQELSYFSGFQQRLANQFILPKLMEIAQKQDPKQIRVNFLHRADTLGWQLKGQDPKELARIKAELSKSYAQNFQKYLEEHRFRRNRDPSGREGIMPDHIKMANRSAPYLGSLARQFFPEDLEWAKQPDAIDSLLNFIQNIPYHTLQSRDNYRGSGFMTPIQVLRNNMGDCDSKATLLAAILKQALPDLETAFVYIPNHAFIAINLPPQGGQLTVKVDGQEWVVADPTGPALFKLGELSDPARQAVTSGYYQTLRLN